VPEIITDKNDKFSKCLSCRAALSFWCSEMFSCSVCLILENVIYSLRWPVWNAYQLFDFNFFPVFQICGPSCISFLAAHPY